MNKQRCEWCSEHPLYISYHDREWGVPLHDDRALFEMLTLEGAQAGLSWLTILKKRVNYRRAFAHFDIARVASYNYSDSKRLLQDEGIVRNRLKIESTIKNAQVIIKIIEDFGSFDHYLWRFVDNMPIQNQWRSLKEVPAQTSLSRKLSTDLKQRGCSFVGPTICYAFMQAIGMVNDHTTDCFRHQQLSRET